MVQNLEDKEALRGKREQKPYIKVGDNNTHDSTKSKETNRAAEPFRRYLNFDSRNQISYTDSSSMKCFVK